jgi:hypothetical protein
MSLAFSPITMAIGEQNPSSSPFQSAPCQYAFKFGYNFLKHNKTFGIKKYTFMVVRK